MDLAGEIHGTEPTSVAGQAVSPRHVTKETQVGVPMWRATPAMTLAMTPAMTLAMTPAMTLAMTPAMTLAITQAMTHARDRQG